MNFGHKHVTSEDVNAQPEHYKGGTRLLLSALEPFLTVACEVSSRALARPSESAATFFVPSLWVPRYLAVTSIGVPQHRKLRLAVM